MGTKIKKSYLNSPRILKNPKICRRLKMGSQNISVDKLEITSQAISVDKLNRAENEIIKCVQKEAFSKKISQLRSGKQRKRNNFLLKVNPRVFEGILRVGGRLQQSKQPFDVQHPIVLPSSHHVTKLIVEDSHRAVGHSSPSTTWTKVLDYLWSFHCSKNFRKLLAM